MGDWLLSNPFVLVVVGFLFGYFLALPILYAASILVVAYNIYAWIVVPKYDMGVLVLVALGVLSVCFLVPMWLTAAFVHRDRVRPFLQELGAMIFRK